MTTTLRILLLASGLAFLAACAEVERLRQENARLRASASRAISQSEDARDLTGACLSALDRVTR